MSARDRPVKVLRGVHLTGVSTRERTPKFLQSAVAVKAGQRTAAWVTVPVPGLLAPD
jgi:hypothetical protein